MPNTAKIIEKIDYSRDDLTYSDYVFFPDEERWEIIDGRAYNMSPAPSIDHQQIALNIGVIFGNYFKEKNCRPFISPIDVKLNEKNIVQPDNIIVCNKDIIKKKYIDGAPDLIVEILSPSTEQKDRNEKRRLYQKSGVKELWFVSQDGLIEQFYLKEGQYSLYDTYIKNQTFKSIIFEDMIINVNEVFRWVDVENIEEN